MKLLPGDWDERLSGAFAKAGLAIAATLLVGTLIGLAWKSEVQAGQIEYLGERITALADTSETVDQFLYDGIKGHLEWHGREAQRAPRYVPRSQ
jgi:hypothetical protein